MNEVMPMFAYRPSSAPCAAVFALLALTGCSPGANLPPIDESAAKGSYQLGAGDQVRIITFGEQQLTGEFKVSDSGNIAVPLLGNVHAGGLTTAQVEQRIATELKQRNLFRNPSVVTEVTAYRPIFVLGEVAKPGEYPYQPGMTVLTAVAVAGGFTYRAVDSYASVVRQQGSTPEEFRAKRQSLARPGDVITVFERRF